MSVRSSFVAVALVVGTVFVVGCAQTSSPTTPSSSVSSPVLDVSSGLSASALSKGVTDVTLANAGWTCIRPGNGLTLCAPPGLGLPSIPPVADNGGAPTYNLMAFTLDHEFFHQIKFLRPDLYHGEPCLGGAPWSYFALINYYECIIPHGI